jgi:hypothetical protein
MRLAVGNGVTIRRVEAEVGAEVHDHQPGRGEFDTDLRRRPVGQGEEHEVGLVPQQPRVVRAEQAIASTEMGMHLAQRPTGLGVGPQERQLEPGVGVEEADEFAPGVAGGTEHGDLHIA